MLAAQAPALLESLDLSAARAAALVPAAREVASGPGRPARPATTSAAGGVCGRSAGIGSWTMQMLALTGQGRLDQLPAGDLAYLKLVGRLRTGDPLRPAPPRRR